MSAKAHLEGQTLTTVLHTNIRRYAPVQYTFIHVRTLVSVCRYTYVHQCMHVYLCNIRTYINNCELVYIRMPIRCTYIAIACLCISSKRYVHTNVPPLPMDSVFIQVRSSAIPLG